MAAWASTAPRVLTYAVNSPSVWTNSDRQIISWDTRILGARGNCTGSIAAICCGHQSARNNSYTFSRNGA